jgi:predicted SnoaL-like aldol condensation-catalyzing enzyme
MTANDNKAVVRRFVEEVLTGARLDRVDELVAPNYLNRAFGAGPDAFKTVIAGLAAALPERRIDIEDMVAEGDAVVIRYSATMADRGGKPVTFRGLTFYRLTGGRIVEDDPITTPELARELGPLLGEPVA